MPENHRVGSQQRHDLRRHSIKANDSDIVIEDVKSGAHETLASGSGEYGGPRVGKYSFSSQGLQFGIGAIKKGASEDLLFVDELGHLEARGEGFDEAIKILGSDEVNHAIVVIRKELLGIFLPRFTGCPHIFETTIENRDAMAERIMCYLLKNEAWPPAA